MLKDNFLYIIYKIYIYNEGVIMTFCVIIYKALIGVDSLELRRAAARLPPLPQKLFSKYKFTKCLLIKFIIINNKLFINE